MRARASTSSTRGGEARKRVGYAPFFPFAERTVVAQIDRSELARFSGLVRLIDAEGRLLGERKLAAVSDCGELVQNMALAISVAIDDIEQATPPAPARTTEPEPPVAPQPTPTETATWPQAFSSLPSPPQTPQSSMSRCLNGSTVTFH